MTKRPTLGAKTLTQPLIQSRQNANLHIFDQKPGPDTEALTTKPVRSTPGKLLNYLKEPS